MPVAPEWVGGSVLVWDFLWGNDWGMVWVPVLVVEWVAGLAGGSEAERVSEGSVIGR